VTLLMLYATGVLPAAGPAELRWVLSQDSTEVSPAACLDGTLPQGCVLAAEWRPAASMIQPAGLMCKAVHGISARADCSLTECLHRQDMIGVVARMPALEWLALPACEGHQPAPAFPEVGMGNVRV
jgi:hypothetical protein